MNWKAVASHKFKHKEDVTEQDIKFNKELPNSDIFSDSFLRRSFAVFGHNLVASLIIWLALILILTIIGL